MRISKSDDRLSNAEGKRGARLNRGASRGITLIELTVAMAMSALVIGVAVGAWTYVVRHMEQQRRKSGLEIETDALLRSIITQLRMSPAVLAWDEERIAFVSGVTGDTITYQFDGEQLLRNGNAVPLSSQSAQIARFGITLPGEASYRDASAEQILIAVALCIVNQWGDSSAVAMQVSVRFAANDAASNALNWR